MITALTARPPEPQWQNIPGALTALRRWVAWHYVSAPGRPKPAKAPLQADGRSADVSRSDTWCSFELARRAYFSHELSGVGVVLNGDGLCGVDFDDCLDGAGNYTDARIANYVRSLDSYTETSPSGKGLRVFIYGKLPPHDRKIGRIEMYDDGRFLSVTGDHIKGTPYSINERQEALERLHRGVFADRIAGRRPSQPNTVCPPSPIFDDEKLLALARRARNGSRFSALYDRGAWQAEGFYSQSEADIWLISRLSFWCHSDRARVDRLFRASGLMRQKWEKRDDYRERTLNQALAR
ncbi:MAG TPA: hypothetical protein VFA65_01530 [Bryobacteraceae bacterium]|nr:hypothetical protein [Bryobacteraceae bacterium]